MSEVIALSLNLKLLTELVISMEQLFILFSQLLDQNMIVLPLVSVFR